MAQSTGVKGLEEKQTYAAGTHGTVTLSSTRSPHASAKDNADPTSFPITSR